MPKVIFKDKEPIVKFGKREVKKKQLSINDYFKISPALKKEYALLKEQGYSDNWIKDFWEAKYWSYFHDWR